MFDCKKVKFATQQFAQFHIEKHKERAKIKGIVARTYLCKCGSWHITSQVPRLEIIKNHEIAYAKLQEDYATLKEQMIEQIKDNVNLKAEVELLKKRIKSGFKNDSNSNPIVQQLKGQLNKKIEKISELRATRDELLAKLNKLT